MKNPLKLTNRQVEFLGTLPDSDGRLCRCSEARTANSLVAKGLVRVTGSTSDNINFYARTEAGRAYLGYIPCSTTRDWIHAGARSLLRKS